MLRSLNGSCHLRGRLPLRFFSAGLRTSARQPALQSLPVASGTYPPPKNISGAPSTPVPPVALPPHRRQVHAIVTDSGPAISPFYGRGFIDDPIDMSAAWRERSGWRGWGDPMKKFSGGGQVPLATANVCVAGCRAHVPAPARQFFIGGKPAAAGPVQRPQRRLSSRDPLSREASRSTERFASGLLIR